MMSDPGAPSALPPRRRRPRLLVALGAVLAVLVAAGVFFLVRDDGPSYPKSWDARIEPYVEIVEKERGLTFEHPVEVRFLDGKEFEKTVRTDRQDLDKDDRQEIAETTSLFRAFGLISGEVDLFDAFNEASGSGTLAYYSFEDRSITVRGTKLSLGSRATLVHELTHALQDQRFGVADRVEALSKKLDKGEPTTELDVLRAINEGDAERVADLYRGSLSEKQRRALATAESADAEESTKGLDDVPKLVLSLIGSPYVLGQALTETVAAQDEDDVDDLFEDPPPDDSVLLDPLSALGDVDETTKVRIPALGDGEKKFDSGQVGALVTYLMLAERIPLRDALAAADLWTGDAYVGFTRGKTPCARVDFATDSAKDAAQLTSAFEEWIAAEPASKASITRSGDRATFESCDPGKAAKLAKDASEQALTLVVTRSYLGAGLVRAGASADVARCFTGRMLEEFSVKQLTDPSFGSDDPAVVNRVRELVADCR